MKNENKQIKYRKKRQQVKNILKIKTIWQFIWFSFQLEREGKGRSRR